MNPLPIKCLVFGCLVILSCATDKRPQIAGRWKVFGTDNVVTLTNKDHSARLMSGGKTIIGSYEGLAPDLLKLTFPDSGSQSTERTITYKVPLDSRGGRTLKVITDTESKMSPNAR